MARFSKGKNFKQWGSKLHIEIADSKSDSNKTNKSSGFSTLNRYCTGTICAEKKRNDRNTVNKRGEECHSCYTKDLTGHLPRPTFFDSQHLTAHAL